MPVPVMTVPAKSPASPSARRVSARPTVAVTPPSRRWQGSDVSLARGAFTAMSRLSLHGSDYGLCQSCANEAWQDELSVETGAVRPSQQESAVSG